MGDALWQVSWLRPQSLICAEQPVLASVRLASHSLLASRLYQGKLPFEAQSRDAPQSRRHLFVPLLDVIIWAMHRPEDLQCTMGLFSKTGHSLEVKFGNVWEIILALYTNPIKPFLLCQGGSFQRKKLQPQKGDLFILQSSNSRYFVVGRLFYPINSNQ